LVEVAIFCFSKYNIEPDIISMAKGMGNGFPIGGILIKDTIKASFGLLGTTFGGNHLACVACLSVLEIIEKEHLLKNAIEIGAYFKAQAQNIPQIKTVKGRGLMLGLELKLPNCTAKKAVNRKTQYIYWQF
jgi:Ornithine/acetylornithine aminotransferase